MTAVDPEWAHFAGMIELRISELLRTIDIGHRFGIATSPSGARWTADSVPIRPGAWLNVTAAHLRRARAAAHYPDQSFPCCWHRGRGLPARLRPSPFKVHLHADIPFRTFRPVSSNASLLNASIPF
jgi:hypothetical protein